MMSPHCFIFLLPVDSSPLLLLTRFACMTNVQDLGVIEEAVLEEFEFNRGAHLQVFWLRDRYYELVEAQMYEPTTRVYMLHLLTCTFFANKSVVYIDARYMWLLSNLDDTNWDWGCIALTILYETLRVVNASETKQLVGYLSLFQV